MFKHLLVAAMLASVPFYAGCGSKDASSAEDANADRPPLDELKAIPEDLGKDVDAILQPINDTDEVVKALDEMPKKYGIKAADLKVMAKASFDGGEVKVSDDIKPEAKEEVQKLLVKIKGIGEGLKAAPDRTQALVAKVPGLLVKVPTLAVKAQASLTTKANNPFGNADEKAKAKADLADLEKTKAAIMTKVQDTQKKITELPQKAKDASAKLSAALAS